MEPVIPPLKTQANGKNVTSIVKYMNRHLSDILFRIDE